VYKRQASWPAPGPVHLHHHARAHALVTLPSGPATAFTPWARLTLMPRALTSAHPQSSNHVPSAPHAASPASPAPLNGTLSSHAMTACAHPQAVAARREPTMTARSQPARSGPGLALHAQASRAPHRARPPQTPQAPHALRCHRITTPPVIATSTPHALRPPQPGLLSSTIHMPGLTTGTGRLKGANEPSLLGHHSLGSVGDPPLQGHHALTHRGILRCSVQIRCQTNYISPSMRSQQVQVGPGR
jgi:hypothetical protein